MPPPHLEIVHDGIPDRGMKIRVGRHDLIALRAHFLHAEGNFQFYDPVSHILFSGDLGGSLMPGKQAAKPVTSLAPLLASMEAFHEFIAWARNLQCGIDLMGPANYTVPS